MTKIRMFDAVVPALATAGLLSLAGFANAITVEIPTTADVQVSENGGEDGASGAGGVSMNARFNGTDRNEAFLMRFDLSGINRSTIDTIELQIVNFRGRDQRDIHFYGVNDGATGYNAVTSTEGAFTDDDWPENGITFSTSPGLEFDGDSTTRGVRSDRVTDLGATPVQPETEGGVLALATPELKSFVVDHPDDIVTVVVVMSATSNGQMRYASKEADSLESGDVVPVGTYAPKMVIEVVPVPFLGVNLPEAYLGDTLNFTWFAPVGATNITLAMDPGEDPGDVSAQTDPDGLGALSLPAPAVDTTYTLSYDFEGSPASFVQEVVILPPFLGVSPDVAVANYTQLGFTWRIPPSAISVILELGPEGGPFDQIFVSGDTDPNTGAGSHSLIPFDGESHFNLRYTVGEEETVLSTNVELLPPVFESVLATGTIGDLRLVPKLLDGEAIYQDRSFTWANVPEQLQGAQYLSQWNDNKNSTGISIQVTAARDATLFLIVDNRVGNGESENPTAPTLGSGVMDWAVNAGFADTGLKVEGAPGLFYSIFFRQISTGESLTAESQADGDTRVLYTLAGIAPQVSTFTNFAANPTVINQGESTTLSWLVPPGSSVSIDQEVGDVTSQTDGITGVGSIEVTPGASGEISYTLTYDPPGADPEATVGPIVVTVNAIETPGDFRILSLDGGPDDSNLTLIWTSQPGTSYRIGYSSTLTDGFTGTAAADVPANASGDTTSHTFPNPAPGMSPIFLRVESP